MLSDIEPKLVVEEQLIQKSTAETSSVITTVRNKEPKFVSYLTKLHLTPSIFKNIQKLDRFASRGQIEKIDSQLVGHFQFYRKTLLKIFLDSDAF
jgi:hypothetical protein